MKASQEIYVSIFTILPTPSEISPLLDKYLLKLFGEKEIVKVIYSYIFLPKTECLHKQYSFSCPFKILI